MKRVHKFLGILLASVTTLIGIGLFIQLDVEATVQEEAFPKKALTMVVTFPPGGGTDLLARKLGAELEARWGHSVMVENRPGASGNIGSRHVAEAKADGYTLLMVNSSFAINPGVYKELGFDPKHDFTPIINVALIPSVLVVPVDGVIQGFNDVLQYTSTDNQLPFASCGNGTPQHLAGELLQEKAKVALLHVPYRGCAPALNDVIANQVPMGVVTISSAMPFIESGRLKAIAVSSLNRSPVLAEVPSLDELGVKGYELDQWHGVLAPKNIPESVLTQLNETLQEIMTQADMQKSLMSLGYTPTSSTPSDFKSLIETDIDRFSALTQRIGLQTN